MRNPRLHGSPPYRIAVLHGGPGAAGEMASPARRLAARRGVLEPIQTALSLEGQVDELERILREHARPPVTLIGFSWGAWLGWILAARHPELAGKLILIGSGPFEASYVPQLARTRMSRLDAAERAEYRTILASLEDPAAPARDPLLARLGALARKTDQLDPLPAGAEEGESPTPPARETGAEGVSGAAPSPEPSPPRAEIFKAVWNEAAALRTSGELLRLARRIRCPVVAIHGDYDPHPAAGVREPLAAALEDFRLILLPQCGHKPWIERGARERFYEILELELPEA